MFNPVFMFLTEAAPAAGPDNAMGSMVMQIAMMAAIFAVFYFLLIRPQRKKDKAAKDMLSKLGNGDRVCTIGGIYGTIIAVKDDTLTLAVGPDKTKMVFARWAIRNKDESAISNDSEALN